MSPQNRFSKQLLVLGGVMLLFVLSAIQSSFMRVAPARPLPALRLEDRESDSIEEKAPRPEQPDEALRFRRLQLQDEKGFIPPDALQRARQHVEAMKQAQRERLKQGIEPESAGIRADSWTWLGPGNIGGRIRAIVIDPTRALRLWAGSVGGGIWTTNDGGGNWQPVNDFMANLAVSTIVINRANTNIMYAGTGEGFNNNDALQGFGVFQSTDRGVTWNLLPSTNPTNPTNCTQPPNRATCPWVFINRLAISPDGNTILAATNSGLWRSTDSAANWNQVLAGTWLDVRFHPTDSTRTISGGLGVAQFSTDGGRCWGGQAWNGVVCAGTLQNATFSPAISNGGTSATNGRVELAYAPSNPSIVYAAVNNNNGDIYRSADGGQNYTRVNTGTNFFLGAGNQGWYDNTIWVSPVGLNGLPADNFVIVGGIDLWRSTDSGTTFTPISRWQCGPGQPGTGCSGPSAHADHHVIVAPSNFTDTDLFRTVYFGNDGGIYRTIDVRDVTTTNGWTAMNNNLGITQFFGAAANYNGVIIGGAQDNGTVRFTGGTESWTIPLAGDGGYCAADPTDPNFFYGEQPQLVINRSTNAGQAFSNISAGIGDANNAATANFIAPFVLDPSDADTMLAGGIGLWRSTNVKAATPNWIRIKNPLPPDPTNNNTIYPISAIAVSPGNSAFILVGHNDGKIFLTFNGTSSSPIWTQIDRAPLPARFVTRLAIDNTRSPTWIYATFGGFSADNVYRSTDLGATWTDITGAGTTGLPNVPVRSLVYHPRFPNFLYVGTEVGIFTSENAGATWELPQNGPANVSVDELFWFRNGIELDPRELIAVTHGRGLYRASSGIYVDCNYTGNEFGTFTQPYRTIAAAINATNRYQTIWIRPCNYNETFTLPPINKRLELRSLGGTAVIGRP